MAIRAKMDRRKMKEDRWVNGREKVGRRGAGQMATRAKMHTREEDG